MKKKLIQKKKVKIPRLNSSEVKFIYDVCRCYLGKESSVSVPEGIRHKVIFDYMRKNGCTGIFFKVLEETDCRIPGELMAAYRDEYMAAEIKNTLYIREVERAAEICRDAGINYVMMKGTALIGDVYTDKGVRPLSDIDLIVESRQQALRLIELMQCEKGSGVNFAGRYKNYVRVIGLVDNKQYDDPIEMEIYFPVQESFYPLSELIFNTSGRFFKEAQQISNIKIPDPSLHFLLLLVHLVHHHLGARLIWTMDIACLVNKYLHRMDWDVILHECERLEFKNALFHILKMLKTTFLIDIPGQVLQEAGSKPGYNRGILKEMVSPRNVIMDSFGAGKIWQFPALSLKKLKTMFLYWLFLFLFNDQPHKWYTFNLGNRRKNRIMADLSSITLFNRSCGSGRNILKKFGGGIVVFLFSLVSFFFLIYYRFIPSEHPYPSA